MAHIASFECSHCTGQVIMNFLAWDTPLQLEPPHKLSRQNLAFLDGSLRAKKV